ncbi:MAG TPA: hypothetical protein VIY08_05460 [Candidatus Nitrosocosmicus sp.]
MVTHYQQQHNYDLPLTIGIMGRWTWKNIEVDFQQKRSPTARGTLLWRHRFRASWHRTIGYEFQRKD